jgi:hypothetical protein
MNTAISCSPEISLLNHIPSLPQGKALELPVLYLMVYDVLLSEQIYPS